MTKFEMEPGREETPSKLNGEEISEILEEFNDDRLRADEHPEFFTIHLETKTVYVPK